MKLESPKRKAAKAKLKAHMFAQGDANRAKMTPPPKRGSWWIPFGSDASLPRETFYALAHDRDREMQTNAFWKQPEKLQQIGQL